MNRVNPIKDLSILDRAFNYLEQKSIRNYMILFLGVNTGLRISDLKNLTIFDFDVSNKNYLNVRIKKTGVQVQIPMLNHVKKEINSYLDIIKKKNRLYLFTSKKYDKPLSKQYIYNIMKNIEIRFNLESLGTHTLRKTFGYHFYLGTNGDIATLMELFGHERESQTLRYLGITQDRIDSQMKKWGGIKRNRFKVIKCKGD
jgi:integrase